MTQMKRRDKKADFSTELARDIVRSSFASLFWMIIKYKKAYQSFSLKTLADKIGVNKSEPSKWFRGDRPNWTLNTVSDIADALDVDLEIRAFDRRTRMEFAPSGLVKHPTVSGDRDTLSMFFVSDEERGFKDPADLLSRSGKGDHDSVPPIQACAA